VVDQLKRNRAIDLAKSRVGILGMAFKADSDDIRDSLAYKLAKMLRVNGAEVVCSDEFVNDPHFVPADEVLRTCSTIVVGVPHSAYRGLRVPSTVWLVDPWDVVVGGCNPFGME
jgi:UDP-N-acetyl-D-mannosaminuronic acid dehydrogenase